MRRSTTAVPAVHHVMRKVCVVKQEMHVFVVAAGISDSRLNSIVICTVTF